MRDSLPIRGRPDGPVILLGSADSLFVGQLAGVFHSRGRPVQVISMQPRGPALPDDVEVTDARPRSLAARIGFRVVRPLAHLVERAWMERSLPRFQAVTGKDRPDVWEWAVWDQLEHAWRLSRLALACRPRCVIGQEIAGYGVPAALCHGVPRILQPWGSDLYFTPESWPGAERLIRYAVRRAELLIPSSVTAAEYLVQRFAVEPGRVSGISWGVDPALVESTDRATRERICAAWGLPPDLVIVQNARRFRRLWGCEPVLAAFLELARSTENTHFVLIGGAEGVPEVLDAADRIAAAGLTHRFTVLNRRLSSEEYNELARVTDVAISLMGRGDMRSASVLVHAARGAALVLAEHPEFLRITQDGFRAAFVNPREVASITTAIRKYVDDPSLRQSEAEANRRYVLEHENRERQMERLVARIDAVCDEFYRRRD